MSTILGFLIALAVAGWGTRWYLDRNDAFSSLVARARRPLESRAADSPLVSREAAEEMMRRTPGGEPAVVVEGTGSKVEEAPRKAAAPAETVPAPRAQSRSRAPEEIVIEEAGEPQTPNATEKETTAPTVEAEPGAEASPAPAVEKTEPEPAAAAPASPPAVAKEESEESAVLEVIIGFCARCRDKREVAEPTRTRTRKGKPAIRGHCVECGAGMFVFTNEETFEEL